MPWGGIYFSLFVLPHASYRAIVVRNEYGNLIVDIAHLFIFNSHVLFNVSSSSFRGFFPRVR